MDGVQIMFNTLVDNYSNIEIGYGRADNSWSREPRNVTMAMNLVVGGQKDLIDIINEPTNFTWMGNIMYPENGYSLGMDAQAGEITVVDPLLEYQDTASDSLWFLSSNSPAIDAAPGNFFSISKDIHGQIRSIPEDVGADEYSTAPVLRRPLKTEDVGPLAPDVIVSIEPEIENPVSYQLFRNFPNPFNPGTTLYYELTMASAVSVEIYNVRGQRIETLVNTYQPAGSHQIYWQADEQATGVYLAVLRTAAGNKTTKLVLMK